MKSSKSQQKTGARKLIKMKTEYIITIFFFNARPNFRELMRTWKLHSGSAQTLNLQCTYMLTTTLPCVQSC